MDRIIFRFLWLSNEKVKCSVVIQSLEKGGLNISNMSVLQLFYQQAELPEFLKQTHTKRVGHNNPDSFLIHLIFKVYIFD